ncbi:MAG: lpxB, partial [Rhodospirillales bacterium]|nr:lpxB [Rhodospirillales bacterium]
MSQTNALVYIIAGEPSGDLLGGSLMAALRARTGDKIRFAGVGGPRMTEQGLTSLFPMTELAVFGLAEILPKIAHLKRRGEETVADIARLSPDALVTIDAPGFALRVSERVVPLGLPRIHYVAPSVWAWKPGRAAKIAKYLTHLMALLPFEPPYFTKEGLTCTFVGHPAIEGKAGTGDGAAFRARHGIGPDRQVLVLLPGSRTGEIDRMLPVFLEALKQLQAGRGAFTIVVPVPSYLAEKVRASLAKSALDWVLIEDDAEKFNAFAAAELALAKSGTVTLELALSGVPTIIGYKINRLTHLIAIRMTFGKYAGLPNVILDRPLMPELLQYDCTPERLVVEMARLLDDPAARQAQLEG